MNRIITLPPHLQDYVDQKVLSGEFVDGIDVIAAALIAMRQRDNEKETLRPESGTISK